jgi:hypothetical protein
MAASTWAPSLDDTSMTDAAVELGEAEVEAAHPQIERRVGLLRADPGSSRSRCALTSPRRTVRSPARPRWRHRRERIDRREPIADRLAPTAPHTGARRSSGARQIALGPRRTDRAIAAAIPAASSAPPAIARCAARRSGLEDGEQRASTGTARRAQATARAAARRGSAPGPGRQRGVDGGALAGLADRQRSRARGPSPIAVRSFHSQAEAVLIGAGVDGRAAALLRRHVRGGADDLPGRVANAATAVGDTFSNGPVIRPRRPSAPAQVGDHARPSSPTITFWA